jgi:hypothetical protein
MIGTQSSQNPNFTQTSLGTISQRMGALFEAHFNFRSEFFLIIFCLALGTGCDSLGQFGLQVKKSDDLSAKYGVTALTVSADGSYVLQWEIPEEITPANDGDGSYEIYLSQVTSMPATFVPQAQSFVPQSSSSTSDKNIDGVSLGNIQEEDSPAAKRSILTTVKGARTYTVNFDMTAPNLYIFQVRFVTTGSAQDVNTRVLIYEPKKNEVQFSGVTGLIRSGSGKMLLTWSPIQVSSASAEKDTTYQVLLQSTRESSANVIARGKIVWAQNLTETSEIKSGELVEFPKDSDLITRGSLIGEVKGVPQYEITNGLSAGLTYILRVQAKTSAGNIGTSTRAIIYRPSTMSFTGLRSDNVRVNSDLSSIDLSWDPVQGVEGSVAYKVYGQGNGIGELMGTSYRYADAVPGENYTFYVTASDGQTTLGAESVVSVRVPIPTTYEGCSVAQARGTTSIELSFLKPRGARQVALYRNGSQIYMKDYVNKAVTYVDSYTDAGLQPDTSYSYTCRVFYDGSTILGVRSVQARTFAALSFAGLDQSGINLAGDGSTLSLTWSPATSADGQVTYYVYDDPPAFSTARIIGTTTGTTFTITNPTRGRAYTLGVRARDSKGLDANTAFGTIIIPRLSGIAAFTTPEVLPEVRWGDGTAKIKLTLASGSSGTYRIFMSNSSELSAFDFDNPWETGIYTTYSNANSNGGLPYIYVGGQGRTFSGPVYFVVREGASGDTNATVSPMINIPTRYANFTRIPSSESRLSYDYYLGTFEASLPSGVLSSNDRISQVEADLTTCSYQFHVQGVAFHTSCGVKVSDAKATHLPNTTAAKANWHQAFAACRNASQGGALVRLPTSEEWRRASRWSLLNYASMWGTYSNNTDANCATSSATSEPRRTGNSSSCVSNFGVSDMAGNVREWVDARLTSYVTPAAEARGGLTPTVARLIANGIDVQTSQSDLKTTQRLYGIVPDANQLALLMGSDAVQQAAPTDPKFYEPESESWEDPTVDQSAGVPLRGFRCVAFPNKKRAPTMAQLALPAQPTYTTSSASIPSGRYAHDAVFETVSHDSGNQSYTIAWQPWKKTVCTTSCATDGNVSYEIYRYKEPTRIDRRTRINWALKDGPYAILPTSISGVNATAMPLDPLFVASNGEAVCTGVTSLCRLVATVTSTQCSEASPTGCSFTDTNSTGFNWNTLYRYVIVAKDTQGNVVTPEVQRFLPSVISGPLSGGASVNFRREIRWRRAGGFLLSSGSQEMAFIPMHQSGLDHDFFIQKYPASMAGVTLGSDNYPTYPSACYENLLRTGILSSDECGTTTWPNGSLGSSATGATLEGTAQGPAWFGCSATAVTATDSAIYRLRLPSDTEWLTGASEVSGSGVAKEWTASSVDANGYGLDNGLDGLWPSLYVVNGTAEARGVAGSLNGTTPMVSIRDPFLGARIRCSL